MRHKTSLTPKTTRVVLDRLEKANAKFAQAHPGESGGRQPVHVVYGGAHLFKADIARKLGALALKQLEEYAPEPEVFAQALNLPGAQASLVYERIVEKLKSEPLEDFHIDFEDGYGFRADEEEDFHAAACAAEVAKGMEAGLLPPFMGIRVKSFSPEFYERSARTLDIFITVLAKEGGRKLPGRLVVTLPKITIAEQVTALAELLDILEKKTGFKRGSFKIEIMIETASAIFSSDGKVAVQALAQAARGRC